MQSIKNLSKRAMLIIMDGYGIDKTSPLNAMKAANEKFLESVFTDYPYTEIEASGEAVGLPKGIMGNSEVGHMNLGAGRKLRQDLVRINESIANDSLKDLPKLKELAETALKNSKRVHLMGLLSDGGVHSHITHIKALIKELAKYRDLKIYFHAFMDGRDTPPDSGINYIKDLLETPNFVFASMQGRAVGMDRDKRWDRVEKSYKMLIGEGIFTDKSPIDYISSQYSEKRFDEFITPAMFDRDAAIRSDDCVFFINYRPDRARELTQAFADKNFKEFEANVKPVYYLCMTPYLEEEYLKLPILFDKEKIKGGLSEYIANLGLHQIKIAETEKYAHVTYFFNGGEEVMFEKEERFLIPSPREVPTYDKKPEMSAELITDKLLELLDRKDISLYVVNYANCDMVGHTGVYDAAIKAVEAVNNSVERVIKKALENNIAVILTADHGNAEKMADEKGNPFTAHTTSPVPFSVIYPTLKNKEFKVNEGKFALKDVAPTVLYVMGLEQPNTFEGKTIFN